MAQSLNQKKHAKFNLDQSETSQHLSFDICAAKAKSASEEILNLTTISPRRPWTSDSPMTASPITPSPTCTTSRFGNFPKCSKFPTLDTWKSHFPSGNDVDLDEHAFLLSNGYKKLNKLCDTAQGELYSGIQIYTNTKKRCKVAIKKTHKLLHSQHISKQENMIYVEKDINKEAKILYHLTISNRCTADYIVRFIDFIESENAYYLIMEYIDTNINLEQFIIQAHKYIKNGKLQRKEYNKVIKYIFWQIFSVVQWMHNDMHCCHLDLNLGSVMLENAEFIIESDGYVHINPSVSAKICDFGRAELFKTNNFSCYKPFFIEYASGMFIDENKYDARCFDMWSLGIMLYHCCIGKPLFIDNNEYEYRLLQNNKLKSYLLKKKIINHKLIDLLCSLLLINELHRLKIMDVLTHKCYKAYYYKYKERILQKTKEQKLQLMQQNHKLNALPYYNSKVKRVFV